MQDRKTGGYYYLPIGQLSPIVADALLALARARFDPHARITSGNAAIETRLIHRAELDSLARDLAPPPRCQSCRHSLAPPPPSGFPARTLLTLAA